VAGDVDDVVGAAFKSSAYSRLIFSANSAGNPYASMIASCFPLASSAIARSRSISVAIGSDESLSKI
jgi:hypothetical protein